MTNTVAGVLLNGSNARPSASSVSAGTLYADSVNRLVYQSDGTNWNLWASLGSASAAVARHGVRVYHSATQTVSAAATTPLAFNSERDDTDSYHDTVTNNTRITIPTGLDGAYIIGGSVRWSTVTAAKQDLLTVRLNGTTNLAIASIVTTTGLDMFLVCATTYKLAVGDYVELAVQNNESSTITIQTAGNYTPEFYAYFLGT